MRTSDGRHGIESFFAQFCADELRGPPKVLHAPDHSFSDVARKVVSIINLASVAALETAIGAPVHPLRFRGNVYVEGWPAWHEFDLVGQEIAIGKSARLKVVKRIVRCAATNVDPDTGARDLAVPETLLRSFGHADCGVYAEVIEAGEIAAGNELRAERRLRAIANAGFSCSVCRSCILDDCCRRRSDERALDALVAAYPDHLAAHEGNDLIWKDGTRMPIADGRTDKTLRAAARPARHQGSVRLSLSARSRM